MTDPAGRYAFLVDNNVYYVTAEKAGYEPFKTPEVDLVSGKREAMVGFDIGLEKSGAAAIEPTSPPAETPLPTKSTPIQPVKLVPPPPPPVTPPAIPPTPSQPAVPTLEVSRESLQDLLKAKEQIKEVKQEIIEEKKDLAQLEEKLEKLEEKVEGNLEQQDKQDKIEPPKEKSIFG